MFHFHFFPIASILLELCHIIRHRDYGFSSFFFFLGTMGFRLRIVSNED